MTIKEFFKKYDHLKLAIEHLGINGGCWKIEVYNTTYDFGIDPIFEHYISDDDVENLLVDFETIIMTPILNWWESVQAKRR